MLVWVRSSALVLLVVITLLALTISKAGKAKKDSAPKFTGDFTMKVLLFARSEKLDQHDTEDELDSVESDEEGVLAGEAGEEAEEAEEAGEEVEEEAEEAEEEESAPRAFIFARRASSAPRS